MAKGQMRGNREIKKPKQEKKAPPKVVTSLSNDSKNPANANVRRGKGKA